MRDAIIRGRNNRLQNKVFKNNTGITALFLSADFLNMSYIPNSAADMNANISHIVLFLLRLKMRSYIFFPRYIIWTAITDIWYLRTVRSR